MAKREEGFAKDKPIHGGIDVHKRDWTVHVIAERQAQFDRAQIADSLCHHHT